MNTNLTRFTLFSVVSGIILAMGSATADVDTMHAGAYDIAIQKGIVAEPTKGYHSGYITRIILDEDYHDWQDSAIVYGDQDGGLERAEFAAFEKSHDLPWAISVVD
ncbi:MAG: hypothetical protein GY807_13810 [Gammaproteobacteria bacterium]|nr:hypothetical protein [Gammaproteobacteria bacterium]